MSTHNTHWLDRITASIAPRWTFERTKARMRSEIVARHYEAASAGRRTQGWRKSTGDANAVIGPALTRLREAARDLVRNNPYAESAVSTVADQCVGWGIKAKLTPSSARMVKAWSAWAETTACDADGRHNFYGLQKLVMRTVVESGEVLVRRRLRLPEDGLPLPIQLQVLDPDFLDASKDTLTTQASTPGNKIVQGVEFDAIGRRVAYYLFPEHPGSMFSTFNVSKRVPASEVLHIFRPTRPGQVRAPTWLAPVLLMMKDFDEFADATLMKQKVAACLAVITSDVSGSGAPLGTSADGANNQSIDSLEPGMVLNVEPGRSVDIVRPPQAGDYEGYAKTVLRAIATGLGVTYEDLTGDYSNMPFSSAKMSRLRHQERIHDWRWRIIIPQFCDPAFAWFAEIAGVFGQGALGATAEWTPPPFAMVDPLSEGLAVQRNVRTGITSLSEEIRARGYDPDDLFSELADDFKRLDTLGLVLDSDPRKMTQAGQLQGDAKPAPAPAAAAAAGGGEGEMSASWAMFARLLRDLPDDRATEILARMFGADARP